MPLLFELFYHMHVTIIIMILIFVTYNKLCYPLGVLFIHITFVSEVSD